MPRQDAPLTAVYEDCLAMLKKRLARPDAPKKGLATIKAFVDSLRVVATNNGGARLRADRRGSWGKSEVIERKTRSELASYHLPMELPITVGDGRYDHLYRVEKADRGSDDYVFIFTPPPSPPEMVIDNDYSEIRRRVAAIESRDPLRATLVQKDGHVAGALIADLMEREAAVELYVWWSAFEDSTVEGTIARERMMYEFLPGFARIPTGSLKVYLYETHPTFHAVRIDRHLIAAGWLVCTEHEGRVGLKSPSAERAERDGFDDDVEWYYRRLGPAALPEHRYPVAVSGFQNPVVIAGARTRSYDMLNGMIEHFTFNTFRVTGDVGPAVYIEQGRIRRLWGGDDEDD